MSRTPVLVSMRFSREGVAKTIDLTNDNHYIPFHRIGRSARPKQYEIALANHTRGDISPHTADMEIRSFTPKTLRPKIHWKRKVGEGQTVEVRKREFRNNYITIYHERR